MANVVETKIQYFNDPDRGRPIYNGYIYVGQPGTDPADIPTNLKDISVVTADGNTLAVNQPLRTNSGGNPEYNGEPVEIVTDGSYSLLVQDNAQRDKFYLRDSNTSFTPSIFDTTAEAKAALISVGDVVLIVDRGNSWWRAINPTTNNEYDLLEGNGVTLQLVQKEQGVYVTELGINLGNDFNGTVTRGFQIADTVIFPEGVFTRTGSGAGNAFTIPANKTLKGEAGCEVNISGYPIALMQENSTVEGIYFELTGNGVSIGIHVQGDDCRIYNNRFFGGNQIVYVGAVNELTVESNYFFDTGYQIIQEQNAASNNCRVLNNTSIDCRSDFVELNSTLVAPSENWLISGNYVENIGGTIAAGSVRTESRFVGSTATTNLIITNNIVNKVAGDSMVHLETVGKDILVEGNVFIDANGQFGSVVFLTNTSEIGTFMFKDNIVKFTSTYQILTGGTFRSIYASGNDQARCRIEGNLFQNESSEPTLQAMRFSDTEDVWVTNNRFVGWPTEAIATGVGGDASRKLTARISDNLFEDCNTCTLVESPAGVDREYAVYIENNTYANCTNVWLQDNGSNLESLIGNSIRDAGTIDEATVIGDRCINDQVFGNRVYSPAVTTTARSQSYDGVDISTNIKIFRPTLVSSYGAMFLMVKATDSLGNIGGANSTTKIIRVIRHGANLTLIEDATYTTGATANFTLSVNGLDLEFFSSNAREYSVTFMNSYNPQHTFHP